jgi:hypothetical protein
VTERGIRTYPPNTASIARAISLTLLEDMSIRVGGQRDGGVAEEVLDVLESEPLRQGERGRRVPGVVELDATRPSSTSDHTWKSRFWTVDASF